MFLEHYWNLSPCGVKGRVSIFGLYSFTSIAGAVVVTRGEMDLFSAC